MLTAEDGCTTVFTLPLAPGLRCNDGACDPQGRMYFGMLASDLTPGAGSLLRVSEEGAFETVVEGPRPAIMSAGRPLGGRQSNRRVSTELRAVQ